jgi:hypothetical protein
LLVVFALIAIALPGLWWWRVETVRRNAAELAPIVVGDIIRLRRDGPETLYAARRQADVSGLGRDVDRNTDGLGRILAGTGRGFAVKAGAVAEVQQVTDEAAQLLFADGQQGWVPRNAIEP